MKKKLLIKKISVLAAICFAVILVLLIGKFWLQSDVESLQEKTQQANIKFEANKRTLLTIEKNIQDSKIATDFYNEFKNSKAHDEQSYRKNFLTTTLVEIKKASKANEISFGFLPFAKFENGDLKSTSNIEIVSSTVSITYTALTDVMVFQIMDLISKKLPGVIYYRSFTAEKTGDIDSSTLLDISEGGMPELVKGEIVFDWIALKIIKEKDVVTPEGATLPSSNPAGGEQNV